MKAVFCAPESVFTGEFYKELISVHSFELESGSLGQTWGGWGKGHTVMAGSWNVTDSRKAAVWGTAALFLWL